LLDQLVSCEYDDVYLSNNSPMGIPLWNLQNSPSEQVKHQRIINGTPGVSCKKGYLRLEVSSMGRPICAASAEYQKMKIDGIDNDSPQYTEAINNITSKSCICHELGGSILKKYKIDDSVPAAICPSQSIRYFKKKTQLKELVDHIYGRLNLIADSTYTHMLLNELLINIEYLNKSLLPSCNDGSIRHRQQVIDTVNNLLSGIKYYLDNISLFSNCKVSDVINGLVNAKDALTEIASSIRAEEDTSHV